MANGWAPDGAVQDQIDDTVKDAVQRARIMMPVGDGSDECDDCGEVFRLRAVRLFPARGLASPAVQARREHPKRRYQ